MRSLLVFLIAFSASTPISGRAAEPFPYAWLGDCPECESFCVDVPGSDCMHRQAVLAAGRNMVRYCLSASGPGDRFTEVKWERDDLCRKSFPVDESNIRAAHYDLSKVGKRFRIDLRLRLDMDYGFSIDKRMGVEVLRGFRACVPEIRSFWNRYGIDFNLRVDSSRDESLDSPHSVMHVSASKSCTRSRSSLMCYDEFKRDTFCRVLAHETGHMVGLPDEYDEEGCPDRDTGARIGVTNALLESDPQSIMREHGRPWELLALYPRHLAQVLAPLCKKPAK